MDGCTERETTRAKLVEVIYEPEQEGTEEDVEVLEDTLEDHNADAIAEAMGLSRVGVSSARRKMIEILR